VTVRGAREGDGGPYPGWHEAVEGLGWPGVSEGRLKWSGLNEMVPEARR
jgi:hypothetical protein